MPGLTRGAPRSIPTSRPSDPVGYLIRPPDPVESCEQLRLPIVVQVTRLQLPQERTRKVRGGTRSGTGRSAPPSLTRPHIDIDWLL